MATAPDPAPTKQKEELVRCSICQETLKEPQTLGCIHSFCLHCLAQHVERQSEEAEGEAEYLCSCPLCRTQFHLKKGERVIRNLLELLDIRSQTQQLLCECCSQVPAGCRCIDCERFMCTNCLTAHKKWPDFKDHEVLTLEQLAKPENKCKAKNKTRCQKQNHGNKVIEFYCNTCKEIACINCIVLDHPKPDHGYEPIAVVAERRRDALKETSAILEEKSKQSQFALQRIERATQVLEANTIASRVEIREQREEILKEFTKNLKRKTAALVSEVGEKQKIVKQKLVTQQNVMKAYEERAKGSLELVKKIIEEGSNEEVISLGKEIEGNANDIEKKCPKLMGPVHEGCLFYQPKSSKAILDTANLNDLGKIIDPGQLLCETSVILEGSIEHAQQLVHWVEDKKFSWQLCYRASRDGWDSTDFHRDCDCVGPTVTLAKCGTNVFGGYTDKTWKESDYWTMLFPARSSNASFLFSLRNKDNVPPFKCEINDDKNDKAIVCHRKLGATFGCLPFDLFISDKANQCECSLSDLGHAYLPPPGYISETSKTRSLLAGSFHFQPTEIEVFRG